MNYRDDVAAGDGHGRHRERRQAPEPILVKAGRRSRRETVRSSSVHVRREVVTAGVAKTGRGDARPLPGRRKRGTAVEAAVPGFRVAGKTSTAQKVDPATGKYSSDMYTAVFVGFVLVEHPRFRRRLLG